MKTFLKILASSWLLMGLFFGIIEYNDGPNRDKRHKDVVQFEIRPYVQPVESFRQKNQRLPTEAEYDTLVVNHCDQLPHGYSSSELNSLTFQDKLHACQGLAVIYARKESALANHRDFPYMFIDWQTNYVIAFWRGEWFEYYISQNDNYTIDDYQSRSLKAMLTNCIVSLAPLLIIIGIKKFRPSNFTRASIND